MLISREALLKEARAKNYKLEMLEKAHQLLSVLQAFMTVPYLRERLVLKGGTAINLFFFDAVPRLSVDIDFNYIGQLDREKMKEERALINDAIAQILQQQGMELYRNPGFHAGGKMVWRYPSILGQKGNLEIDLNYMYRQPLWPVIEKVPHLLMDHSFKVPVLDIHELTAGKLSALFSRFASRDIFDAYLLLTQLPLDIKKLRLAFVVYLAMTNIDLQYLKLDNIQYESLELKNQLLPTLNQKGLPKKQIEIKAWSEELIGNLKVALKKVIPLKEEESLFIELIRKEGEIKPELITQDAQLQNIILLHPAIKWAAQGKQVKN